MFRKIKLARHIITGGFLKGKRTYIVGVLLILQAIADYLLGDKSLITLSNEIPEILVGMGVLSGRAAIDKLLDEIKELKGEK